MSVAVKRSLEEESSDPNKKPRPDTSHLQEIRILIENPEASIIIGKGGTNVKDIRNNSGAFVSILKAENPSAKERVLTLKGIPEHNAKAGELITRLLISANNERKQSNGDTDTTVEEYSLKLLIHKFLAGCIIGKGGTIIKEIQQTTGVKMSISNEPLAGSTEKQVSITGSPENVHAAITRVFNQLQENPLRDGSSNVAYIPGGPIAAPYAAPFAAAPYGKPGYPYGAAPQQQYSPYGQMPPAPYAADPMGMKTEKIVIPSVCAGTVIGKSGSIIAEIKSQSGCQISIAAAEPTAPQDRVVSITGTAQGINAAIQYIRQRVESYQPPEGMAGMY